MSGHPPAITDWHEYAGIMRGLPGTSGTPHSQERSRMAWKKLESRVVFDNPWITVFEDRVVNPGGGRNDYGHVHFKNRAVAIVPLDEDGNTWLVGQDRYTLGAFTWELPMGGAPLEESPLAAAKRELKEETGLTALKWTELMQLHTSNSITDEVGVVFIAEQLKEGQSELEETENIELRKLKLKEAVEMAVRGEITDAISVAALLAVARRLSV
jgi:8-oxo-dGTP pyrophosphatase MutT (NUDIX family)